MARLGLSRSDGVGFDHGVEDDVASLHGALGVAIGIAIAGILEETGESGALREIELAQALAEEHLRGLAESIDLVTAAMAEIHLVGVHRRRSAAC